MRLLRPAGAVVFTGGLLVAALIFLSRGPSVVPLPAPDNHATSESKDTAPASASERPGEAPEPAGTVIRTRDPAAVDRYARTYGLTPKRTIPLPDGTFLVSVTEGNLTPAILALEDENFVESIAPNYRYRALDTPTDPNYPAQWNLPKVSAPAAWDTTTGLSSTVVAVIDTGVYFDSTFSGVSQPDLPTSRRWENPGEAGALGTNGADDDGNGYVDDRYGWDFMGGWRGGGGCPNGSGGTYDASDNDAGPYSCDDPTQITRLNKDAGTGSCGYGGAACYVGHGTMVASLIAAQTNNGQLIAGIDRSAKIMNLRVLDGYGFGDSAGIAAAVSYAGARGAHVINLSLGLGVGIDDPTLSSALLAAKSAGAVIVAASGNDGTNGVYYPASSPHAIAVGASDSNDSRAGFSSYGSQLDLVAPGVAVPVANAPSARYPENYYSNGSGTSFAAPHVTGAAALLRAIRPTLTPDQVREELVFTADKVAGMGDAESISAYGHGRLNLSRLMVGSLRWQMVSQSSSTGSFILAPGSTAQFTLTAKNMGQATWNNTTNPVRLGTWAPTNRSSSFHDPSWTLPPRPTALTQASVAPGANGTFVFTVKAPTTPGFYVERFNLAMDGVAWFHDPWMEFNIVVRQDLTWQMVSQSSSTGSFILAPGSTAQFTLTAKNTGNVVWTNSTNPVRLGTWAPTNRSSTFHDSSWILPPRPALLQEASVAPGANGTFVFTVRAPTAPGFYVERFNLAMDGVAWFHDPWMEFDIVVQ